MWKTRSFVVVVCLFVFKANKTWVAEQEWLALRLKHDMIFMGLQRVENCVAPKPKSSGFQNVGQTEDGNSLLCAFCSPWSWPWDLLWPVGQYQMWFKQRLKKCFYTGFTLSRVWDPLVHNMKKPRLVSWRIKYREASSWNEAILDCQAPGKLVQTERTTFQWTGS